MQDRLTISIAMTTYNGERFLQEQLDSFLWQTRLPDELVVCDDGSTDRTLEILEAFARKAPFPVRIYRNPQRLGFTKNFEKAALMCSGDLIAFSDQDDVWLPEKLEIVEETFRKDRGIGVLVHDAIVMDEQLAIEHYRWWDHIKRRTPIFYKDYKHFFKDLAFQGNCLIIKRTLLDNILPVPSFWSHDKWIPFVVLFYTKSYFYDAALVKYRIHANQTAYKEKKNNITKFIDYLTRPDSSIYLYRYRKWSMAEKCLPVDIQDKIATDINNKIKLIINMFCSNRIKKCINIIKYYFLGFYHTYEHGTRSMLRDLLLAVSIK